MNIAEFMSTLPKNVVSGEEIALPEQAVEKMFSHAD